MAYPLIYSNYFQIFILPADSTVCLRPHLGQVITGLFFPNPGDLTLMPGLTNIYLNNCGTSVKGGT